VTTSEQLDPGGHAPAPGRQGPGVSSAACRTCGNEQGNEALSVREMVLGLREPFGYLRCGGCGSLQLQDVPSDLGRYYPNDYYSFTGDLAPPDRPLLRAARRARTMLFLRARRLLPAPVLSTRLAPLTMRWMRRANLSLSSAILDVGCGSGQLLSYLQRQGFTDLEGIDPFLPAEAEGAGRFPLRRATPADISGRFDFVMMNHVFEHVPDPAGALKSVRRLLAPGGTVLIRVPLAGSWASQRYGANWAQLDAPRHLFVFSAQGMETIARTSGFEVRDVFYDSEAFQFWASEQYERDIPLRDERSYAMNPAASIFSPGQIRDYQRQAALLNRRGEGDQAGFLLTPVG
jgi:SAM-dependent methyltransferase